MTKRADGVVAAHPLFHAEGGGSIPTSALQLQLHEIDMRLAAQLNRQWHSMLPRTDLGNLLCGNMSAAYAAMFNGQWYAVGIWSQPIIHSMADGKTVELRRLAICSQAPKNTASRMLAVMCRLIARKYPFLTRAISYQAVEVHTGGIYKAAGWIPNDSVSAARPQRLTGQHGRATGPLQTHSPKRRWEKAL